MTETIEESKCLASLAVFRELYNSEKDVYGIISEFLVEIILTNAKHTFNITEITNLLNETYDFSIPEAVIRTSLNKIKSLTKENGIYTLENIGELKSQNINSKKDQIQSNNDEIIESLFEYVKEHRKTDLDEKEKTDIVHSFISFIIDGTNGDEYSEYVGGFIISKKDDSTFKEQLSTIKEGVVLYSGIKYNTNLNDIGSWRTDLTIFIETEILFHFGGFNGEVYKKLWDDFHSYVLEINRKHPNRIKLRYFQEVNDEIERFFKKAEYIIEGKDKANPRITAMMSIIDGCNSKADIVSKKAEFFRQLSLAGIKQDDYTDYFSERNHKFNIVDENVLKNLSNDLEIDDPSEYLRFLNFVSIQRKDANENNFDNIGYILLSGNSKTIKIAWNENVKMYGQVPLATTLSFLTNKFWFKLNKGFGKGNFPLTFDVITKAQIVLANQINESVGKKFEELQSKFKTGGINEEQAKATIIELRKQSKKPEEVLAENVDSILEGISEESIEVFLKEQEHFKNKAHQQSKENTELKSNLNQKEQEVLSHVETQNKLNIQLLDTKKSLLNEKKSSVSILDNQKTPIDKEINNRILLLKVIYSVLLISAFIGIHFLILKFGWNDSEQWTWIFFYSIPLFISLIYMLIAEKTINPIQLIIRQKEKIKEKKYRKFNFDSSLLERLNKEVSELENEITELKASTQQNL